MTEAARPAGAARAAGMPSREIALGLISSVLDDHRSLTDALERGVRGAENASTADKAFGRLIAVTVLRRLGELDAMIAGRVRRPLPRDAQRVQHVLRIVAAQIAFLGTAPHAAVNCAVEQAKRCPGRYAPLVNAVARRFAPISPDQPVDAKVNVPGWLWQSWSQAYGTDAAAQIAAVQRTEPPLDLSIRAPADTEKWAAAVDGVTVIPGTVRLARAHDVPTLPGFVDGAWWVQDVAASLPARLLLATLDDVRSARIADLCAAPGGKTAQLVSAGATVTAVDADPTRLVRLRQNLDRLKLTASIVAADARIWSGDGPYDAVLLDAPCTATGNIRRHPDIPWLKRPTDVAQAAALQRELLHNAWRLVRPGGHLVYAVCSLQPEEGKQQIAAFLREAGQRVPITAGDVHGLATPDPDGDLQTLPVDQHDRGGMDGFFIARLLKDS